MYYDQWGLTCPPFHFLEIIVQLCAFDAGDPLRHELVRLVQLLLETGKRKRSHLEKTSGVIISRFWKLKLNILRRFVSPNDYVTEDHFWTNVQTILKNKIGPLLSVKQDTFYRFKSTHLEREHFIIWELRQSRVHSHRRDVYAAVDYSTNGIILFNWTITVQSNVKAFSSCVNESLRSVLKNEQSSASSSFIFGLFQRNKFYNKLMWKCPSTIQCRELTTFWLWVSFFNHQTRPSRSVYTKCKTYINIKKQISWSRHLMQCVNTT